MSELLKDLRSLSDEELVERHDLRAGSTQASVNHYLREIVRRDQNRQTKEMLALTKRIKKLTIWITIMTMAIMIATIASVAATIYLIQK